MINFFDQSNRVPSQTRILVSAIAALAINAGVSEVTLAQGDEAFQLEEVIVTATKRKEKLQDVPATVRALGAELLEELNVQNISDVVVMLPNVQVKGHPTGDVTIRGIASSRLGQSPVSFHVNNVFKYSVESYLGQFYDLQNVEVIQGPTGTVYGRNSTAGAMNVMQRLPVSEFQAYADVTAGNYSQKQIRAVVNVPFFGEGNDGLMGRFVVQRDKHDGYIDNKLVSGDKDYGAANNTFLRGSLRSLFGEDSEAIVRGYWNENKDNYDGSTQALKEYPVGTIFGAPFDLYNGLQTFRADPAVVGFASTFYSDLPTSEAVDTVLLEGVPAIGFAPILSSDALFTPAQPAQLGNKNVRSSAYLLGDPLLRIKGLDGEFNTSLGETRLNINAGWENTEKTTVSDVDGTELPVLDVLRDEEIDLYSAEIRLTSESDGPLSWILGAFYFSRDYDLDSASITPFGTFGSLQEIEEEGLGLFVSAAYEFADAWEVFGGLRQNKDNFDFTEISGGGGIGDIVTFSDDEDFSETTGELGIKYSINDSDMVYLKFNHGYKAGSLELDNEGVVNKVNPELIDAWEAGARTEWFGQRLRLNLTAFSYDYTDLQVPIVTATNERTENAGEATVWGFEVDGIYLITPNWELSGSVGYLNAEFDEFCAADEFQIQQFGVVTDAACLAGPGEDPVREGTLDLSGNTLEDSPNWKAVLLTSYDLDLAGNGSMQFTLQSTWTDNYYLRPYNIAIDEVDSFTKTDIRVKWKSPENAYYVEAFVENIEDETNTNRIVTLPDFTGGQPASFGAALPRIYGLRLGYNYTR